MPKIDQMREMIAEVYPGIGWKNRCWSMPISQVIAIYKSFLKYGKFEKPIQKKEPEKEQYHQMDIFELYGGVL